MNENLREALKAAIDYQRETVQRMTEGRYTLTALELEIVEFCDKRLAPFGLSWHVSLLSGSIAHDWCPHVYVMGASRGSRTYCKIAGEWRWYDGRVTERVHGHRTIEGEPPFDAALLERVCATLAEEIGIPVLIHDSALMRRPPGEAARTEDDVLDDLPGAKIVAKGSIWHLGSNVSDKWLIVRDAAGTERLFYSMHDDVYAERGVERIRVYSQDGQITGAVDDIRRFLKQRA